MPTPCHQTLPARLFRVTVGSSLEGVREACRDIRGFLQTTGVSAGESSRWELALSEAATNIALHGYGADPARTFDIEILCEPDRIEARLTDQTTGFDWPAEVRLPDSESESGRGMFLIDSLMDSVRQLKGGGDNCLVLRKSRDEPAIVSEGGAAEVDQLRAQLAELEETLDGMTEELASSYESLAAIFKFSEQLGQRRNLKDFARLMLEHLCKITEADWYLLRLREPGGGALTPFAVSRPDLQLIPVDVTRAACRSFLEVHAVETRQDVWIEAGVALPADEPLGCFTGTKVGIVHPFFLGDDLIGTLAVGKTREEKPLSAGQINVAHTFAEFLSLQVVNARYQEEHVHAQIVSRELEIAATIQRSLLPVQLPRPEGFTLAGHYESAQQVGGDFYDAMTTPGGGLLLAIADVMGKGVPAAMFASILRTVLRTQVDLFHQPAAMLRRANEILFRDLDRVDMFVTAQLVYIDPASRTGVCASAGHCPLLLANASPDGIREIEADGPPLGIGEKVSYTDCRFDLPPGSRLLMYTDGVYEARNADRELWGTGRLGEWWRRFGGDCPDATAVQSTLIARVREFRGNAPATDDLTFLVLCDNHSN